MIKIGLIILLTINSIFGFGQCCSPGNPVGGTSNLSIVSKKQIRISAFYKYGYSNTYFEGNKKSDFKFVDNASYNYFGSIITYGLFKKLNLETELGYYLDRTQNYNFKPVFTLKGTGLSDAVISLKYNYFKDLEKEFEFTGAVGVKIPFKREPQKVDNVVLPIDVQTSSMAYGVVIQSFLYKGSIKKGMNYFLLNRFESNFESIQKYKFGQSFISSLFVTKSLNLHWTIIMQIRDEWRNRDTRNGKKVNSSGGNVVFISPQLNYEVKQKWNISMLFDYPLYKYYNGTQLTSSYAITLFISKNAN